jgi:DNA-binding response OmpR family regulator
MAKVLIVDDDPDVVEAGRLVLEKEGHELASAVNREDGLRAIESFKPDVLILDVMMEQPDDGIAMAQELRRKGFKVPILMLTNISRVMGMTYDKDESVVPVDDFQEKPIHPNTLIAKVNALLKKKEGSKKC